MKKIFFSSALFAGMTPLLLADCPAGLTNATSVVTEPALPSKPGVGQSMNDPSFGACIQRVTDGPALGSVSPVHAYSQLQAWNRDQSLILINGGKIIDAQTFQLLHTVTFGYPATGRDLRWSPTDPHALYYFGALESGTDPFAAACGVNALRLMRYRLIPGTPMTGQRELVKCFPEYQWSGHGLSSREYSRSFEELSRDGRYIAIEGFRASDGVGEMFVYDLINDLKSPTMEAPLRNGNRFNPDWVAVSPLGRHLVVSWGSRETTPQNSVEAYDFKGASLAYAGKIAFGRGHSDLAVDDNGTPGNPGDDTEWLVDWEPYTENYIKKNRLPNGYDLGTSEGGVVRLLQVAWSHGQHISCQGERVGWCAVTTMGNGTDGWQPLEDEVFKVFLDSTAAAPHVERLAHHRSDPAYFDSCPGSEFVYWGQPHASVSPDGSKIIFGSTWEQNCLSEAFQINLGAATGPVGTPSRPRRLRIQ